MNVVIWLRHRVVQILLGLGMISTGLAFKIDFDHSQEVYYALKIKFGEKKDE